VYGKLCGIINGKSCSALTRLGGLYVGLGANHPFFLRWIYNGVAQRIVLHNGVALMQIAGEIPKCNTTL